jgi:nitrogen regulatory protein PII
MENAKRIEIITGAYDMRAVIHIIEQAGLPGYTLIPEVRGKGERGSRDADGLTEAFKNSMLLLVCEIDQWEKIQEPIRQHITRVGGMVMMSDCSYLKH